MRLTFLTKISKVFDVFEICAFGHVR